MPRYIDADALLARYDAEHKGVPGNARRLIEESPTISPDEVRGVVRCKDCTFGKHETDGNGNPCVLCENSMVFDYPYAHDPDWFCADWERMKGAEDGTAD